MCMRAHACLCTCNKVSITAHQFTVAPPAGKIKLPSQCIESARSNQTMPPQRQRGFVLAVIHAQTDTHDAEHWMGAG